MKLIRFLSVLAIVTLAFSGCESKTSLSRSKAKHLIETSKGFSTPISQIALTDDDVKQGISDGYWHEANALFLGTYLELTDKGKQAFKGFEPQAGGVRILDIRQEVRPLVGDVTGIADVSTTEKTADFTFHPDFSSLPLDLQAIFKNRRATAAQASFKLYDDGWRVEQVTAQ